MQILKYAFKKDIGAREDQQDNVIVLEKDNIIFIALGDGMGGHRGGNFASHTLIDTATYIFNNSFNKGPAFAKSKLSSYCFFNSPITFPISFIVEAPTLSIILLSAVISSSLVICAGR